MYCPFKIRYNLNFISDSKIFIFFFLSCISFFRASEDFAREKNKLNDLKHKLTVASDKLGKLKSILKRIETERTFKVNDSDMADLASSIHHLRSACFKRVELYGLSGLGMRLDNHLSYRRGIVKGLNVDLNGRTWDYSKKSSESNEMIIFILKALRDRDKFNIVNDKSYSAYRKKFNNSLEALGYKLDSVANKYLSGKYWNHAISDKEDFAERKQLWGILNDYDPIWDSICKMDTNGRLGEYYEMSRFSELLSKVFPSSEDDYIFMRILNKKIFLNNLFCGLPYISLTDEEVRKKIIELLKKYEIIILSRYSSESEIKFSTKTEKKNDLSDSKSKSKVGEVVLANPNHVRGMVRRTFMGRFMVSKEKFVTVNAIGSDIKNKSFAEYSLPGRLGFLKNIQSSKLENNQRNDKSEEEAKVNEGSLDILVRMGVVGKVDGKVDDVDKKVYNAKFKIGKAIKSAFIGKTIVNDAKSLLEYSFFKKKVEEYSFFWFTKKEEDTYSMELRGIDEGNNLCGLRYNVSDFLMNDVEKLKRAKKLIAGDSIEEGLTIVNSIVKITDNTTDNTTDSDVKYSEEVEGDETGSLSSEENNNMSGKIVGTGAPILSRKKSMRLIEAKSMIDVLKSERKSIQMLKNDTNTEEEMNDTMNSDADSPLNAMKSAQAVANKVTEEPDVSLADGFINFIGDVAKKIGDVAKKVDKKNEVTKESNTDVIKNVQKGIREKNIELKKIKEEKPWKWQLSIETATGNIFNKFKARKDLKKKEWKVVCGNIVISNGTILNCNCELVKVATDMGRKKAFLKIENGELKNDEGILFGTDDKIILKAYQKRGNKNKIEFDISTIKENFTINFRKRVGVANIKFHLDSKNDIYKVGHLESDGKQNGEGQLNYTSYCEESFKSLGEKINSDIERFEFKYNELKQRIISNIDNEIGERENYYIEKEQRFEDINLGFLKGSTTQNHYIDFASKMIEVKSKKKIVDVSSLDFLAGNRKVTEIDSKIHGIMLSTANRGQEFFMEECKKEYEGGNRRKRENWKTVRSRVSKYYSSPETRENIRAVREKKINESNRFIDSVLGVKNDLSYSRNTTKNLSLGLESLSEEVELISNNMKNKSVPISTEIASELSRNGNGVDEIYDKKPILRDTVDMLKKIKNRLAQQFTLLGGDFSSVNSEMNILPDNYAFLDNTRENDIFYQISNSQSSEYLYKASGNSIFRSLLKGFIYPFYFLGIDFSTIYGSFNSFFSSRYFLFFVRMCNFFFSYIAVFFATITVYDFYVVFTGEPKRKKKNKRRRKGKKVTYMYMVRKSLYKTCSRIISIFSYPYSKKSKKVKIKKKKRRKKINRR